MTSILDLVDDNPQEADDRHHDETSGKRSVADKLVGIARELFEFGISDKGDAFAIPAAGPRVPIMLRGGHSSLRGALASVYVETYDRAPNANALTDALLVCEGWAMRAEPVMLFERVARLEDGIVVDLGQPNSAACVVVTPAGRRVVDDPPAGVLFRRTKLTAPLPLPRDGHVDDLRAFLHMDDCAWALLLGWIVAMFFSDIPHPVLAISGEQGSAKSTTARLIIGVTDPSPAPLRRAPRDEDEWLHSARSSHALAIDNISTIPSWLSDALCRASTGDATVKRQLYTDSDQVIFEFRRCVILTGIAISAVQGDLIDRLVTVELDRIDESERRLDSEITRAYEGARAGIFGGLMTLLANVLKRLPDVHLAGYPRMADYAKVLAAIDAALPGAGCLEAYEAMYVRGFEDAVEGNMVAHAVTVFMDGRETWTGTASDLHERITPSQPPKGWPRQANHLSNDIFRAQTILRAAGITIERTRSGNQRTITLNRDDGDGHDGRFRTPHTTMTDASDTEREVD